MNVADTIVICYDFPPGIQGPDHPNPGTVHCTYCKSVLGIILYVCANHPPLTLLLAARREKILPHCTVRVLTGHTGGP